MAPARTSTTIVFYCILLCFNVFYCVLMYSNVFYCILLCFIVFYCVLMYSNVFYCIVLCFIVFYYILLYSIVYYYFLSWTKLNTLCSSALDSGAVVKATRVQGKAWLWLVVTWGTPSQSSACCMASRAFSTGWLGSHVSQSGHRPEERAGVRSWLTERWPYQWLRFVRLLRENRPMII